MIELPPLQIYPFPLKSHLYGLDWISDQFKTAVSNISAMSRNCLWICGPTWNSSKICPEHLYEYTSFCHHSYLFCLNKNTAKNQILIILIIFEKGVQNDFEVLKTCIWFSWHFQSYNNSQYLKLPDILTLFKFQVYSSLFNP